MTDHTPAYNVVIKTLVGTSEGVITRTSFQARNNFEQRYRGRMLDGTNRPMREVYEVVAHGVSDDVAQRLVASPENTAAILSSMQREAMSYFTKAAQSLRAFQIG